MAANNRKDFSINFVKKKSLLTFLEVWDTAGFRYS